MDLPRTERAIRAILDQLRNITPESGYHTDAGSKILRSRPNIDRKEVDALIVWDLGEIVENGAANKRVLDVRVELAVDVFVLAEQDDTGERMELAKADVKKCIGAWETFGGVRDSEGGIGALSYRGATMLPREPGARSEGCRLLYDLVLTESRFDPASNKSQP